MKSIKIFLALAFFVSLLNASAETKPALQAINSLDVPRYLGRWYEIAKFPNKFQKQCVSDTTAEYSLKQDGSLQVLNRCRLDNGNTDTAIGAAKQVGGSQSAKLKVRFAPEFLSLLPFVWGDYWVVDIDDRYELVAVSEPKREYLWILARTPKVDDAKYAELLTRLNAMGLDIKRLEKSPQLAAMNTK